MTDNDNKEVVKWRLCEGQGKLRRLEVIERQGDGELTSKVEALGAGGLPA